MCKPRGPTDNKKGGEFCASFIWAVSTLVAVYNKTDNNNPLPLLRGEKIRQKTDPNRSRTTTTIIVIIIIIVVVRVLIHFKFLHQG